VFANLSLGLNHCSIGPSRDIVHLNCLFVSVAASSGMLIPLCNIFPVWLDWEFFNIYENSFSLCQFLQS
jgi:hypothetical protein